MTTTALDTATIPGLPEGTVIPDNAEVKQFALPQHQMLFVDSPSIQTLLLDGGFGAGKTLPLCLWALNECDRYPNNLILIGRHHYTDLADSTIRDFFNIMPRNSATWNESTKVYTHPNGSQILFRHLDDDKGLKNLNLGGVGIDQAEEIDPRRFDLLLGRLRKVQSSRTMRLTCNPNGHDWLWQYFYGADSTIWASPRLGEDVDLLSPEYRHGYKVIRCTSHDNPHLPDDYIARLTQDMSEEFVQQYVYGSRDVMLGYRYFNAGRLKQQVIAEPTQDDAGRSMVGYFVDGFPKPEFRVQEGGPIRIYEMYDQRDPYCLGLDIATGEGTSWSAGVLRNCRMNRVALVIDQDMRPDELAVQAYFVSRAYGNAVIAPERNGLGFSVVTALQQLTSNIFSGQVTEFGVGKLMKHVGWLTDAKSRMELFSQLQREIGGGTIELRDRTLIEQCKAITMTKGKPQAERGFRDDLVIALGISGMVRKMQPNLMQQTSVVSQGPIDPPVAMGTGYGFGRKGLAVAGR
jgi:hypothetical protein